MLSQGTHFAKKMEVLPEILWDETFTNTHLLHGAIIDERSIIV